MHATFGDTYGSTAIGFGIYRTPVATFQTNVIGTANVLQAAFECKSEPIVAVITSDKCYENLEKADAFNEGDRMGRLIPIRRQRLR